MCLSEGVSLHEPFVGISASPTLRPRFVWNRLGGRIAGGSVLKLIRLITAEAWLTVMLAAIGILGFVFVSHLVAEPKLLFGRSLTAIPPTLFPALVLATMAVLACMLLYSLRGSLLSEESKTFEKGALGRVVALFGVMLFYALTMAPFGFFISSALSMAAVAWLAGNRSILQIVVVSVICPIGLYIVSTRGLAVSLPELSSIEFLYARVFDVFASAPEVSE